MNLSGHRNDNIQALSTPTLPTSTMGLSTTNDLPTPYGSEVDPVFDAWLASPTGLTKSHVGLGNVDNTSDVNKPLSTATTNSLALKQTLANLSNDIVGDAASTTKYPSVKAIKDYADLITGLTLASSQLLANLSTNLTTDGASDVKYPSCKAVKTYVDARIPASTAHSATTGLQGGTSGQYYHLTQAQHTIATQAASALQSGYLTAADYSAFSVGSGGVATSLQTTNFKIQEITGRLVVLYGSTEIFSFSSAGLEKGKDDIIAFTTP